MASTLNLEAIKNISNEDHWDFIEKLSEGLEESSALIAEIHGSIDLGEIKKNRVELAESLAYAQIYIDIAKIKFSIMDKEWSERTGGIVEDINKQYASDENFDEMDF